MQDRERPRAVSDNGVVVCHLSVAGGLYGERIGFLCELRHNGRVGRDAGNGILVAGHGGSDVCAVDCEFGETVTCVRSDTKSNRCAIIHHKRLCAISDVCAVVRDNASAGDLN